MANLQPRASSSTNIGTFVAAIVGSVGLLFLLSFGLAISLYCKQRAFRNRSTLPPRDVASLFTEDSDDRSRVEGPSSFIPRFFSDSLHPPPAYMEGGAAFSNGPGDNPNAGYAERPLSTPPRLREETHPHPNLHKAVIPKAPPPVYTPDRVVHPSV